jgi:hypothetical protein
VTTGYLWVYIHVQNTGLVPIKNVRIKMPDADMRSVPERGTLSSHVSTDETYNVEVLVVSVSCAKKSNSLHSAFASEAPFRSSALFLPA